MNATSMTCISAARPWRIARRSGSAAAFLLLATATIMPARAATFAVTSNADGGAGSLRQAMLDANAAGGANSIEFALPGAAFHVIALSSPLPPVSSTLLVDGYSQTGAVKNTVSVQDGGSDAQLSIEVVGNGDNGFSIASNPPPLVLTLQGLNLHGFADAVQGSAESAQIRLYGNFIGTARDGGALPGNGNSGSGIRSNASSAQIGGVLPWQRNVISGNGGAGIFAGGAVVVEGNLIGCDAGGMLAIPNGTATNWGGIILGTRQHVRIGGAGAGARNVISGNRPWGIGIWAAFGASGAPIDFAILGNFIGSDWSGQRPLGNGFEAQNAAQFGGGIQIQDASAVAASLPIGGFGDGEANLIAWNRGAGIVAASNGVGEGFDDRGNAVHDNRGVGRANIDIGVPGPTPNDAGDDDAGANNAQNWPEILSASQAGDQLEVSYRIDTAPVNAAYPLRVDFHANAHGGSALWLGQDSYGIANAQQPRSIVLTLPHGVVAIPFVAIATDANGCSSEISPAFDVIFEDGFE